MFHLHNLINVGLKFKNSKILQHVTLLFHRNRLIMNKTNQKQSNTKIALPGAVVEYVPIKPVSNFNILPSPTKSFSDKKEYRVVRLENGLTACLISDFGSFTSNVVSVSSQSESESDDEDDESSEGSSGSDAESVLVSDEEKDDGVTPKKPRTEVKLAAVALCIGVGSFSDPEEVPGLAHFLEHMVFMGSKKFPQENDFDAYIKKHGGSDNASTDYEATTFYFECFEKHLYHAMDKFAQFFISPLMKRESMTREREAIESEFQMAMPSDDHRKDQLLASFAKKSSPVNSFSWGNLVTLKDNISDDELYEMLHEFRKRHYSAHRMTLAIQARLPIDMLEMFVVNCFNEVPNNNLPPEDFKMYSEGIFDTPNFSKLYYVKPVKDVCQVDLTWVMPSLQHMYKSKPHVYVSWLLGHEGKGSLLSYLKKRVWALTLFAGNEESGGEFNSLYATFSVNIVLTKEGFAHLKEVIEAVFGYLKLLKDLGPNERIFKEIQSIEETSFRFEEDETASDKVEDLVECMQFYPPEDYLTGPELFFEYDPDAISMVLNHLVPEKMNIMVLSSNVPNTIVYNKVEPWFKTQYSEHDIPADWLQAWLKAEALPCFAIPEPNRFLTEDFSLLPKAEHVPEYPEMLYKTPLIELWYRRDQKFELPMAYYCYHLITPYAVESAKSVCMIQMLVGFLIMHLAEEGYAAQLAELSYEIDACEKGIYLKLSGYNEKLPMLLDLVTKCFKTVGETVTPELFEAVKEKQTTAYYNGFIKPTKLCKDLRLSILQNNYFSLLDRHAAISEVTFEDMLEFVSKIFTELYIQGLIQGNITEATALETTQILLYGLQCSALPSAKIPKITVNELPKGEYCCRVMSFNPDNTNSITTNYYQCGVLTIKDNVILEFIMLLIEEPLFDILRTKEQLGYNVYATIRDTYGILGYSVTVNSQADKFTTQHVDGRIEAFLKHSNKILKRMNEKKFKQTQHDLIKIKQCVDVDLEDEVERNWEEIVDSKYIFDRIVREMEAVENLRMGDIKKWWDARKLYNKKDDFRKLSIQVVGHKRAVNEVGFDDEQALIPIEAGPTDILRNKRNTVTELSVSEGTATDHETIANHLETEPLVTELIISTLLIPHVDASTSTEEDEKDEQKEEEVIKAPDKYYLEFIENPEEATHRKQPQSYFITDVNSFKRQLKVYLNEMHHS